MTGITINGKLFNFPTGTNLSNVIGEIDTIDYQCRRGQCGRCLVEVVNGSLGIASDRERSFLELMDLNPKKYRLLCQCCLKSESVVNSFGGY
ncbi:2Fe-2S iron-sulfur cluster binding domain-containing protein [Salmonella enterica]|nr:2Fe-2S iron-sulfur cluster binding domain-containing protein [Salmonella enterica]